MTRTEAITMINKRTKGKATLQTLGARANVRVTGIDLTEGDSVLYIVNRTSIVGTIAVHDVTAWTYGNHKSLGEYVYASLDHETSFWFYLK